MNNFYNNKNKIVLLHWNGRFGNRMFTYAFLRHYAEAHNLDIWLPSTWEGTTLFENCPCGIIEDDELRLYLNQTQDKFDNQQARLDAIKQYNERTGDNITFINPDQPCDYGKINVCIDSLCCYHPHIFTRYSRHKMVSEYFSFSRAVVNSDLYKKMKELQGTYIIAHLRRDDIANVKNFSNRGYSVIAKSAYEKAFIKYGFDANKVEWVTDDRSGLWGIKTTLLQDNWVYPEGSVAIKDLFFSWFPDFLKIIFARVIFRANSSFSWWASFLSDAEVYSPRLCTRQLYHETAEEIDVEFERGNHPHWICVKGIDPCDDIIIN